MKAEKVCVLNEDAVIAGLARNEALVSFLGRGEPVHFIVDWLTLGKIRRRLQAAAVGVLLVGEENVRANKVELNRLDQVIMNGKDVIYSRF